ncbi:MAG: Uma2 family endonuclease, partial [Nocardioidaceae bacterium]
MTADPADALVDLPTPAQGWTTDDLDALPESHRKLELIDGALIGSPSPTSIHQSLILRLGSALDASCPAEYAVTQGVEVRLSTRRSFIPDVLVMTE